MADPGSMYQLVIDQVKVLNQRDKDHDDDDMVITAGLVLGAGFGSSAFGVGSEIHTGQTIDGRTPEDPGPPTLTSNWVSPVIVLPQQNPDDAIVAVNVAICNTFDEAGQGGLSTGAQLGLAALAAIGADGYAESQDATIVHDIFKDTDQPLETVIEAAAAAAEIAVVTAIVGGLAMLFLNLFGKGPSCAGPVFDKMFMAKGSDLDDLVAAGPATSDTGAAIVSQDGCGENPHTQVVFRWVRRTDLAPVPVPSIGPPRPGIASISPRAGARASAWTGQYGTSDNLDFAEVAVELTAVSPDIPLTEDERVLHTGLHLQEVAAASTRRPDKNLPNDPVSPAAVHASEGQQFPVAPFPPPRIAVQLTDRFLPSSPLAVTETATAVTQLAGPFVVDTQPVAVVSSGEGFTLGSVTSAASTEAVHVTPGFGLPGFTVGGPTTASATRGPAAVASTAVQDFAGQSGVPTVLRHAQTLQLSDGATLQLYGAYAANGQWIENHLRYQRVAIPGVRTTTDVMLIPAQHGIR